MATVTGYTAPRMKAIEDSRITAGFVDLNGNLLLTKGDGSQVNAGYVRGPAGPQQYLSKVDSPTLGLTITGDGTALTPWTIRGDVKVAPPVDSGNLVYSPYLRGEGPDIFIDGATPYTTEVSPTGSPAILLNQRDHKGLYRMNASPGDTLYIECVAKKITGTAVLDVRVGQSKFDGSSPSGTNWYSTDAIAYVKQIADLGNGWVRYSGVTQIKKTNDIASTFLWLQINQSSPYTTTWAVSDVAVRRIGSLTPYLTANEDLNRVVAPGTYIQNANAQATLAHNYPDTKAGFLEVISTTDYAAAATNGVGILQRYTIYNDPGMVYTRSYYTSWSPWRLPYATDNDASFTSLTGYLASGITYTPDSDPNATPMCAARRVGPYVELAILNFTIASMDVGISGNVANTNILTGIPQRFRPKIRASMMPGPAGRVWSGLVHNSGDVIFAAVVPSADQTSTQTWTNQQYSAYAFYPAADAT